MDKSTIGRAIRLAFKNVPYPGDSNLVVHDCWECVDLAAQFRGTKWVDWLGKPVDRAAVSLLSAAAFHYYLPAFLLSSLSEFSRSGVDAVIFLLGGHGNRRSAHSPDGKEAYLSQRISLLSAKQIKAIVDLFGWLRSRQPQLGSGIDRAVAALESSGAMRRRHF